MKKPLIFLLGMPVALVAGLLTTSTGASAAPAGWTDGTADCRDVQSGWVPKYRRFVDQVNPPSTPLERYTVTLSGRGVVDALVTLSAASCTDVTYTMSVYKAGDGKELLGTASAQGNGLRQVKLSAITNGAEAENLTAFVQVVTSDRRGTLDFSPDVPDDVAADANGKEVGGGQAFGG